MMDKPNIVITLRGGLVQAAYADQEIGHVTVLDFDTDNAEEKDMVTIAGTDPCYIYSSAVMKADKRFVKKVMKKLDEFYGEDHL